MKKSILLSVFSSVAALSLQASNVYVGGYVSFFQQDNGVKTVSPNSLDVQSGNRLSAIQPGLYVGYEGKIDCHWRAGVELGADFGARKEEFLHDHVNAGATPRESGSIKRIFSLAPAAVVKYQFEHVSPFVKVGGDIARYKLESISNTDVENQADDVIKKKVTAVRFMPSVGLDMNLTESLRFRTEVGSVLGSKKKTIHTSDTTNSQFTLKKVLFAKLGVNYRF